MVELCLSDRLIGRRYGLLTVESLTSERNKAGCFMLRCRCDCGDAALASKSTLNSGKKKSCGCLKVGPKCSSNLAKLTPAIYREAKSSGMTDRQIAKALGVSYGGVKAWKRTNKVAVESATKSFWYSRRMAANPNIGPPSKYPPTPVAPTKRMIEILTGASFAIEEQIARLESAGMFAPSDLPEQLERMAWVLECRGLKGNDCNAYIQKGVRNLFYRKAKQEARTNLYSTGQECDRISTLQKGEAGAKSLRYRPRVKLC